LTEGAIPSSYRDPSGFVFRRDGVLYRQVNQAYRENFEQLIGSGLYGKLVDSDLLIAHDEVEVDPAQSPDAFKILKPEQVPFISYPYEWCFSQLRDAAKTTLEIQKIALDYGMTLKDCTAYNIQFVRGRPVLIDTLSFETYVEGRPWTPYRQFCQHFLAPLALMALKDVRFNQLFRVYIDGVPLDLAGSILPARTKLSFALGMHIHLHARSQQRYSDTVIDKDRTPPRVGRQALLGMIGSLQAAVGRLNWKPKGTEWVDYYSDDSYVDDALKHKQKLVGDYLDAAKPATVWDLGANTGMLSRIAADRGAQVVAFDIDPACVEVNYRDVVKSSEKNILPLLLDLTNPSPRIGWDNRERDSVQDRGPADLVMALALIHHLAISNNVPLPMVAGFLAQVCRSLIIEFVPKTDAKVKKLLATREDIFPNYTQEGFEEAFREAFDVRARSRIEGSDRVLYLMSRK